jgi:succinoglycan biosynthesis transport protein ExoP
LIGEILENDKSHMDIKSYWGIFMRRKILLVLPLIIVPLVAYAFSYFIRPSYVSAVTIMIGDTRVLPTTVEQDIEGRSGYNYVSTQDLQNSYLNQMTSTKYLRRLIAVLNIPISPEIMNLVGKTKVNFPQISENDLAENILADQLRRKITVGVRANNLIEVSFSSDDPVTAQKEAGSLADIFIEENLASELAGIRSSISFSEEQLAFYKDKLKNAEDKLREFRQSLLTSSFGQDTSSSNLREIVSAVQALDMDISGEQDQQAGLRSALDVENFDVNTLVLPADISSLQEKLLGNVSQLSDLLTSYNWRDVKVVGINEESRGLIEEISSRIRTWVEQRFTDLPQSVRETVINYLTGNIILDFNRAKRASLDSYIGKTKSRLGQDPATEITIQRLQSEIDSYKRFYDLFVSHSQNAAISQSAKKVEAEAKFTIIRPASLPLSPDSPNRIKILGMGLILGMALGFGAIIIVELLDDSFKKVEDVTEYLKLPVVGTIPRMDLPFGGRSRKRLPVILGAVISLLLVVFIVFLKYKKNG